VRRGFALLIALGIVLVDGRGAVRAQPDPVTAARFSLTIDGSEIASFSELGGITSEIETAERIASSSKDVSYKKLPGKNKPPTVTLKRGHTQSAELWAWHEAARTNTSSAVKNASLIMFDVLGQPVARYHLVNAWPSKVEVSTLQAGESQILYEELTLTCDHVQRVAP
jgi:phage tail-like protein